MCSYSSQFHRGLAAGSPSAHIPPTSGEGGAQGISESLCGRCGVGLQHWTTCPQAERQVEMVGRAITRYPLQVRRGAPCSEGGDLGLKQWLLWTLHRSVNVCIIESRPVYYQDTYCSCLNKMVTITIAVIFKRKMAARKDDTFEKLLLTFWIRPATWLHFVCEIATAISWSPQRSWWGLLLDWNASYFFLGRCGSLIVHAWTMVWSCRILLWHFTRALESCGWFFIVLCRVPVQMQTCANPPRRDCTTLAYYPVCSGWPQLQAYLKGM